MKNNIKHIFFMTIFLAILVLAQSSHNYDKLLLQDLKTFTVFKNRVTKGRRSRVLQLECTEGDACQYFQPQSMQCIQIGFDGYNASWKCETQLEDYYYLGYTKVSCEGYSYPDDKYITRDSCGVRYSLYLTEKGKEHFRNNSNTHNHRRTNNNNEDDNNYSSDSGFYLLVVIAIIIVIYIIYQFYKSWKETHNGNNTNNNNNNNDDQPPPYGSWEDDYNNDHRDDDHRDDYHHRHSGNNNNSNSSGHGSSTASRLADLFTGFVTGNNMRNRNNGSSNSSNYFYGSYGDRYSSSSSRSRNRSRSRSRSRSNSNHRSRSNSNHRSPSPPRTYTSYGFGDTERR
ncbi:DUF1183-domain-containing protein [Neocallimastix lanati (nom. inval.)]|nr:DUF1183-domain-containing protein [Neocallimastix sp. JGI-2020a]